MYCEHSSLIATSLPDIIVDIEPTALARYAGRELHIDATVEFRD